MGIVERYLELGLRLGRHVDGLVDSYIGPPELAEGVEHEPLREPAALAADAGELLDALGAPNGLDEQRCGWLQDQVGGLHAYAGVLAGEQLAYSDEVERCYGVRPEPVPEESFGAAHAEFERLLPGDASLEDRYEAWRLANAVPPARILDVMHPVLALLRERTQALVPLPADEEFALELVAGEPWAAFNYYLGGHRSRIVVNTDLPLTPAELVVLAAHEGYPGHHTEHAVKEQLLLEERGQLEESLQLVPTPQALLSEGIAEVGTELLAGEEISAELTAIFTAAGVPFDAEESRAIAAARKALSAVVPNAAIMIHEDGLSVEEAQAYVSRWALVPAYRAERMVGFVVDPTWRAYVTTYTEGLRLCRAYVGGDLDAFGRLLTQQVRVGELLAAANGDAAVSSGP
jgi:hypothetical protein